MQKLLVISLLFVLTGCFGPREYKPQFKVGDCIMNQKDLRTGPERWESKKRAGFVHKIMEIGHAKYRIITLPPDREVVYESDSDFFYDDIMQKVDCPSQLGVFYE